jgi:hypothetical protein
MADVIEDKKEWKSSAERGDWSFLDQFNFSKADVCFIKNYYWVNRDNLGLFVSNRDYNRDESMRIIEIGLFLAANGIKIE